MSGFNGWFVMLALMVVGAGSARGQSADELYTKAESYFNEQTWDRAIDLYGQFVKEYAADPRVPDAEYNILSATSRLARWDGYVAKVEAFCKKYPNTLLGARGKLLWARYLYQRERWNSWERIGALYAEALLDYRKAKGRRPFSADESEFYAKMLFEAADFAAQYWTEKSRDTAKQYLQTALELKVKSDTLATAHLKLGALYLNRLNDPKQAEAEWLIVFKQFTNTSVADDALFQLGQLSERGSHYIQARDRYLELRRRYPKSEFEKAALERITDIEAPRLDLRVSPTHLPGAKIPTRINARNLSGVKLTAYRVDLDTMLAKTDLNRDDLSPLAQKGKVVAEWDEAVPNKHDYGYQSISFTTPLKEAGLYVVQAVAKGHPKLTDRSALNISGLVLVQNLAARKLVSYVADRGTRQPVAGAQVRIFRPANKKGVRQVATGVSDADGLVTSAIPQRTEDDEWQLVSVARRGQELAIVGNLYAWWQEPTKSLSGYVYTDRPVYRPDNTVHFRGILRYELEGQFSNLPSRPVAVRITDPRGEEKLKTTLQTDAFGTIGGDLKLDAKPTLGEWSIQLTCDGQTANGEFRVEEYRKPEFKVEIGRPMAAVRPGGAAAVPVTATYYFGAPVAEAEVKFVVQKRVYRHWYWFPGPWDWFYAGWRDREGGRRGYGGQQVVKEGKLKTDAKGQAVIEFPAAGDAEDYTYSIYAEVADVTRRVVDATGSLTVTQKGFFLAAHASQGLYQPEHEVSVNVKAENADAKAIDTPFAATLYLMKWVPEKRDPKTKQVTVSGHYERGDAVWKQPLALRTDPDSGKRDVLFKAPGDGYYQLELKAPDTFDPKASIETNAEFWVASNAWKGANYNYADLQLITEKDLYQKGQTARILVNSPVPSGALLLTIGAAHIYSTKLYRFTQASTVIEVPILPNYRPNVFLSAVVVGARQVYFARKDVMVPPTEELINVKVTSDQAEYKPRTKGTFVVETTDASGKPVPAQVSLGITDESVYAIQEELASPIGVFFYGRQRSDEIRTACSFEGYGEYDEEFGKNAERQAGSPPPPSPAAMPAMAGAPGPGAAGGRKMAAKRAAPMRDGVKADRAPAEEDDGEPVAIREFFPDTILWQPTVTTGADGKATITVDFPDSLTTWRATARAVTTDTHVGQLVSRVITSKDLIVRLQAPRFFTQLDQSLVSVVVTNKTDKQQQVAINLAVDGLTLVGDKTGSLTLAPRGQARLDRQVNAVEPGKAAITVTARGPNDSDGVKQAFEIIPHGADKFAGAAGQVGADGRSTITLNLPEQRRPEATKLTVTVQPTLASTLLDALAYLVQYPYGCVEQTTSKFLPAVLVARTLDLVGKPGAAAKAKPKQVPEWWTSRGLDELPAMVKAGMERLAGMQNSDGGFGWFGGMRSDVWMTAYVTYALSQARLADFPVPQEVLGRSLSFLSGNLHLLKSQPDSSAYVAWVLSEAIANKLVKLSAAQAKDLDEAVQRVYTGRDDLNGYTRALLILTLVDRGDQEKAQIVWRNLQARRIETENGVHWGDNRWGWRWSEDQVETTSFALMAALAVEPNSDLARKAVQWLVLNRTGNRWYSTKDTSAAIFAICRYADAHQELKANYSLKLAVNGQDVKGWEVTPQNALTLDGRIEIDRKLLHSGDNTLQLTRDGQGSVYYSAFLEYYTKEDPITAASSYVSATRKYYQVTEYTDSENRRQTRRDELKPGDTVASGEQIEVEVTVNAENEFDYVCFADPKPAGCEPVDQTSGGTWGGAYMYRELRDKEVTFFVDHLAQGKTTFTYRLRAETPGAFRALPHHGFSMYRPDVRCLSNEAILKVGERKTD